MASEYKGLVGRAAKEAFRAKWSETKVENAEVKLATLKAECHQLEDSTTGTYLPFKRLWESEGSDDAGFQAFWLKQMGACQDSSCSAGTLWCTRAAKADAENQWGGG
jgi:hypothetical protein